MLKIQPPKAVSMTVDLEYNIILMIKMSINPLNELSAEMHNLTNNAERLFSVSDTFFYK